MAQVAIAMAVLLTVAIYSLSRLSSPPWASSLRYPSIQGSAGTPVPKFELQNDKKVFKTQNLVGHWTLLSFWSFTCPPCLEEMPALSLLANSWSGPSFEIMTINVDKGEDAEMAKNFLEEEQIAIPTLYDAQEILKKAFAVQEYPRHFLINPEGKIVWSATGAFRWNENKTRDQLLALMSQRPQEAPGAAPNPESEE